MGLFKITLNDAQTAIKKNEIEKARKIITEHKQHEVQEERFLRTSLMGLKLYLENYIRHLTEAANLVKKEKLTDEDKIQIGNDIQKCKVNIDAFEKGVKELLQKEGEFLK